MKVGLGFDRLTQQALSTPAVSGQVTAMAKAGGQQVAADCVTIHDIASLHTALGVSVEAGGSYMGGSASAKVNYLNQCDCSTYSTYVLVIISVQNAFESIDSPAFTPDAVELLTANNSDRFRARFGDSFISGLRTGGEYFAIYQLTGTQESKKESMASEVHAAFNGVVASAELNLSIKNETSSSASHLEVKVHVFRQGAVSTADLNVEDIMTTAKQFPVSVSGDKAFPYAVTIEDYSQLKSPNDAFNYYDIKNQQDVLADMARKRFEFLELRDNLSYVLKHTQDFENADGTQVDRDALSKDYDTVMEQIRVMQREMEACSKDPGKCEFTSFDTSKFAVPKLLVNEEDTYVGRGETLAAEDPLATALRNLLKDDAAKRGFDLGMGVAEGQTLPGPVKDKIGSDLKAVERTAYTTAVEFTVARNANAKCAKAGAAVAEVDPAVETARNAAIDPMFALGFDIGVGLFGPKDLGALGSTLEGPGSTDIRDKLPAASKKGFAAAVDLYLVQRHQRA